MKKIKQSFYLNLITTLFMLSGCSNTQIKTSQETVTIRLDFTQPSKNIHEIGLINDVQILSLDCKEVIFGDVNKIIRYKDRIYLMDKRQTHSIIIYDTLGNYINLISMRGKGPEEYIQLADIFIDPENSTLNIISRVDKKLLTYDLDGKRLLGVEKTPKAFTRFSKLNDGYVGYMGNYSEDRSKPYNVWTMSPTLELGNPYFDIAKTWESIELGGGTVFSTYKTNTYCILPMDYNIYAIEKEKISVPYFFDLGRLSWPAEYQEYTQVTKLRNETRHILRFYDFQETPNHLIVRVLNNGQYLLGVYHKQSSKTHIARLEPYMDKYFFPFGQIIGFDESAIFTLVDAAEIKKMWDGKDQYNDFESAYPEQIKRLREKFNHINEEGAPFLVMYSMI